jgi:hypothetical protein
MKHIKTNIEMYPDKAPTVIDYNLIKNSDDRLIGVEFFLSNGETFKEMRTGSGDAYYYQLQNNMLRFHQYMMENYIGADCGYRASFDRHAFRDQDGKSPRGVWTISRHVSKVEWGNSLELFATPEAALKYHAEKYKREQLESIAACDDAIKCNSIKNDF